MSKANSVLTSYLQRHPPHFWRREPPAKPLALAQAALEDAQAEFLEHGVQAIYHAGMRETSRKQAEFLREQIAAWSLDAQPAETR